MAIHLFIAPNPTEDRLIRDGRVIGNVTTFEVHCGTNQGLVTRYDLVGSDFVLKPYTVENSPPSDITHPLHIEMDFLADSVKIRYELEEIPLVTQLYVLQTAMPRTRLIRLTVLNIDEALRAKLVALRGVEVVVDHVAREKLTKVEERVFE